MRIICPKILNWTFFATVSQIGVAYSTMRIFRAFMTFSQLCLAYPVLKIFENWKKRHTYFQSER